MNIKDMMHHLTVLYLEDDPQVRANFSVSLSYLVNKVYDCENAECGLNTFQKEKIDVIITDIDMPGMDGITFIKEIRKIDRFVPIIITTSYKTESYMLDALSLYIDKYLVKPVTLDQILEALYNSVERIIELNRMEIHFDNGYKYNIIQEIFISPNGNIEKIPPKEKLLFELLLSNKNQVTTYYEIEEELWGSQTPSKGSLKLLIKNIRNKVGKQTIANEIELGYKLII